MKKLILAFLGFGISLIASAQLKPTFVYDDGTIRSGYFDVSSGFGGVYWSQGAAPTPYSIDSTKRTSGIVAAISMNSSNVTISPRVCGQTSTVTSITTCSSAFKPNKAPGLFSPFVLTFGVNTSTGIANSVNISSNPVLKIKYKKPATPQENYYVVSYTDGATSTPSNDVNKMKVYQLSTVTGYTSNTPTFITGTATGAGNVVGNAITGLAASAPFNLNNSPLRVTIQITDINKNKLELTTSTTNYTTPKLGFTLTTSGGEFEQTINLNNLFVLDTVTSPCYPGNAFICQNAGLGRNGCPAVRFPLANTTNTGSPFDYTKVTQVLFYLSGGCAGSLSVATTLGVCGYGVNYTCYDNTLTVTSFALGNVPAKSGYPGYLKVRTVTGSTSFNINWLNTSTQPEKIAIARSSDSTGGWVVVRYLDPSEFSTIDTTAANFGSNTFYDGTVGGASFYKIGGVNGGLITWAPGYATVGFSSVGAPVTGATTSGISFSDEYLESFSLSPNPTNGTTSLKFGLIKSGSVSYKVFNSLGQEVTSVSSTYLAPGSYSDEFSLSGKTSGLYFVAVMIDGKLAKTERLILE